MTRWQVCLALLWLAVVGSLTLTARNTPDEVLESLNGLCLLCGDRGTADALLNVLLFVPLGLLAGGRRCRWTTTALAGLLVSVGVEGLQAWIPGRHPSPADVLWNSVGAVVGWTLWRSVQLRIGKPSRGGALRTGTAIAIASVLTGLTLRPTTGTVESVSWTPEIPGMPRYEGTVLAAEMGGDPLDPGAPAGALAPTPDDWLLRITLRLGMSYTEPAPVLALHDRRDRPLMLVALQGSDVVLYERTVADALRLDDPGLRMSEVLLGTTRGDTVDLTLRRVGHETCTLVDDTEGCSPGLAIDRTWSLLLALPGIGPGRLAALDLVWVVLLASLVGFTASDTRDMALAMLLASGGASVAILLTRLSAGSWLVILAGLIGAAGGRALRSFLEHRRIAHPPGGPIEASV